MPITLEAIKFNHDPLSANADAFNIRKNECELSPFPEWQRGRSITADDSVAAYAISPTRGPGKSISIQAKFKSSVPGSTIKIQAVDASSRFLTGNILGTVTPTDVTFGANGESNFVTFILDNVRLESVGVGISKNIWRWQFLDTKGNRWADFAKTAHKIYSVIDQPREPWSEKITLDNTQLPWTEVLDVACNWAAGAKTVEHAAELITRSVYELGLGLVGYQGSPAYALGSFNCADFLRLVRGQVGMGKCLNCSDCATIVSTFANILGCKTSQVRFGGFMTNPIILISHSNPGALPFFTHEVAWTGDLKTGTVLDACLQVDGDGKPSVPKFAALLPTNLPFGPSNQHYRFCVDKANKITPRKIPHLPIGTHVLAHFTEPDSQSLNLLKKRFDFNKWKGVLRSETARTDVLEPQPRSRTTWEKVNQHCLEFDDGTKLKSRLFRADRTDVLLREDLFKCHDRPAARELLLRLLGEFSSTQMERLEEPGFADVAFVAKDDTSIVFASQQSVVLIRLVGDNKLTLKETGLKIGELLTGR